MIYEGYEGGPLQWLASAGGPLLLLSSEYFSLRRFHRF